jgi:hypothetical protein
MAASLERSRRAEALLSSTTEMLATRMTSRYYHFEFYFNTQPIYRHDVRIAASWGQRDRGLA